MTDQSTKRPWKQGIKHPERILKEDYFIADTVYMDDGSPSGTQFANAALIVKAVNAYDQNQALIKELKRALDEISKGKGAFSLDPLKHAQNTIENMKFLARHALTHAKEMEG